MPFNGDINLNYYSALAKSCSLKLLGEPSFPTAALSHITPLRVAWRRHSCQVHIKPGGLVNALLIQRDLNRLEEQADHELTNSTRTQAKPGAWEGVIPCSISGWGWPGGEQPCWGWPGVLGDSKLSRSWASRGSNNRQHPNSINQRTAQWKRIPSFIQPFLDSPRTLLPAWGSPAQASSAGAGSAEAHGAGQGPERARTGPARLPMPQ